MKKNTTAQGYLLNTIVLVVLFVGMQVLTSVLGGNSSFKLVLAPCLWQCCYLIILLPGPAVPGPLRLHGHRRLHRRPAEPGL